MRPDNAAPEPEATPANPAHEHRVERYQHIGFTEADAELLATMRDADGIYVYWGDVDRVLQAGGTHDQVMACYA